MFDRALANRAALLTEEMSILRLFDGAGDGLPGVYLDTFADRWLVSTSGSHIPKPFHRWVTAQGKTVYHKRLDQKEKESPLHLCGPPQEEPFLARENGLAFEISFQSGYSQGIFPDQRLNRAEVMRRSTAGDTVLNTFSYTGAFSTCAAASGAKTTTLDLSQPYLEWARRNMAANGLTADDHYFCKGDTFHWLQRFAKQRRTFSGIVLDPPTFARDHKGKVFRIEKDYGRLIALAESCLAPSGWILACTNYRRMWPDEFESVIRNAVKSSFQISQSTMPQEYTGEQYLKSLWLER